MHLQKPASALVWGEFITIANYCNSKVIFSGALAFEAASAYFGIDLV